MRDALPVGAAIPVRLYEGRPETLMVQRSYWHHDNHGKKDRPRNYAGEWVFPANAGYIRSGDTSRRALLALRKELGYSGDPILDHIPFHSDQFRRHNKRWASIDFWIVRVEDDAELSVEGVDELLRMRWDTPGGHLDRIGSDQFRIELANAHYERGFIQEPAGFIRQPPWAAIRALRKLGGHRTRYATRGTVDAMPT